MGACAETPVDPNELPHTRREWKAARYPGEERKVSPDLHPTVNLLCYNILCDGLANKKAFRYARKPILEFDYRSIRILKELRESEADIMCFQEMNKWEFYQPRIEALGYECHAFIQNKPYMTEMTSKGLVY